ncbi:MAG: hypothetical protein IJD38_02590 [Clostridia bacterium]|nr:hypothetical protein [Clostridia bacterium]
MAKLEMTLRGDFFDVVRRVTEEIVDGSLSAELEDSSDFQTEYARCSVRVFERYSFAGGNRVSLTLTFFSINSDDRIFASAITSGGSQAVFLKLNTWGEETFLDKAEAALSHYKA